MLFFFVREARVSYVFLFVFRVDLSILSIWLKVIETTFILFYTFKLRQKIYDGSELESELFEYL